MEGPPRPYTEYIHDMIKRNIGKWKEHRFVEPGIMEHISDNDKIYTIRVASTSNARYSTDTIRKFADLADKYFDGYMRFTGAFNPEFFAKTLEDAKKLKKDLESMGFPVGGWENHLWNITSCAGYFHCALAATDAPSIAKSLGDAVIRYFNKDELPAKFTLAVSGCPSACGGAYLADISIVGIHTEIPIVTENIKSCDLMGTAMICPVGAIQLRQAEKTIEIRENLCIGCGLCVGACSGIIFRTPEKTDGHAVIVGGKASSIPPGTQIGRVVIPFIPNDPPRYELTVKSVLRIIETWKKEAKKGERLIAWIERIGWEKFFEKTGIPFFKQSMDDLDLRSLMLLREGGGK